MKTGVGSWAGDSVIVRRVQNQLKDLGMAVLAAEAGYAVIVAAPEQLNADAQEVLDRYKTMFTVIAGKDSMKQAMEKAKELQTKDNARKVVIVVYPEAENADVFYTYGAEYERRSMDGAKDRSDSKAGIRDGAGNIFPLFFAIFSLLLYLQRRTRNGGQSGV